MNIKPRSLFLDPYPERMKKCGGVEMWRWEKLKIDLRLSNTHIKQARSEILCKTEHGIVLIFSQELTSSQAQLI